MDYFKPEENSILWPNTSSAPNFYKTQTLNNIEDSKINGVLMGTEVTTKQVLPAGMHTHRCLGTFEHYPGGKALVFTSVTIHIEDAEGSIASSLRTDLHHTQVNTVVF